VTQFLRCAPPFSGEPEPPLRRRSGSPAVHAPGRRLVIKRDFSVSRQCWWAAAGQRSQRRGLALKSRLARSRTGNTKSAQPLAMPLRGMEAYSGRWLCLHDRIGSAGEVTRSVRSSNRTPGVEGHRPSTWSRAAFEASPPPPRFRCSRNQDTAAPLAVANCPR
jgi:hypothetical protein